MTNALVRYEMDDDQVTLIKRMIAKDATNDDLDLFLNQCRRTGLDPLSKQIYAISRFSKQENRKVMSIQVSIDGARLIAERTGKYDSQEGPYWCGEDGIWKDVWLAKGKPHAAKVLVYKVGSTRGTTGIAHWSEYADERSNFWTSKPALMLAKCAESLALRKAFPQELSGLYTQEEMGQAENAIDTTYTVTQPTQIERQVDTETGEMVDNPSDALPKISEDQRKKLNAIGHDLYGDEWDTWRHAHAQAVSNGRTMSSGDLTRQEASALIDKLDTLLRFEDLGQELYGDQWPAVCRRNAKRVTAGATEESDKLTTEQLQMLIDGMMTVKNKRTQPAANAQEPIATVA